MQNRIEKALREKVGQDMEREGFAIAAHDCLARILADKWQGKPLNARIATQFKEAFVPAEVREKVVVYYLREHGHVQLLVWGIGPYKDCTNKLWLNLAFESEPSEPKYLGHYLGRVNVEGFEYGDACHGRAAKERQQARQQLCQGTGLAQIAAAVQAQLDAAANLERLTDYNTLGHQVVYYARDLATGKVSL